MRSNILRTFFFTVILCIAPFSAYAETGFISEPMWIYPDAPTEGQTVSLSALFHNAEKATITGTVLFYDDETLLGRKTISIAAGGVSTATTVFRIGAGKHSFSATMSSLTELSASGSEIPLALPLETARMGAVTVAKIVAVPAATVVSSTNSSGSTSSGTGAGTGTSAGSNTSSILKTIDSAETVVSSVVPKSIQEVVTTQAKNLDAWRSEQAASFTDSQKAAKTLVDSASITAAREQKLYGRASPTTKYIDGPFAYVKLAFFWLLSFLFSYAVIFYVFGALVLFFVLRAVFRRLARYIRERRAEYHYASIPKAPRF